MTTATPEAALADAQDKWRAALIERLGTFADLLGTDPLPGDTGDVAYDLLRQAAAQISSDRLRIAALRAKPDDGVDDRPDLGSPDCKIITYNEFHELAVEMGYPSMTEAFEHLDELRAQLPADQPGPGPYTHAPGCPVCDEYFREGDVGGGLRAAEEQHEAYAAGWKTWQNLDRIEAKGNGFKFSPEYRCMAVVQDALRAAIAAWNTRKEHGRG